MPRGARRIVGITHGHEAGWAALPGARSLLRRIGEHTDVLTYLGEYFRVRLARALTPQAAERLVRLAPGVDTTVFRPGPAGERRCATGSAWPAARWCCASPAWSRARGRTR